MKIGYFGFNNGPLDTPDAISSVLQCAEAAGFESAWTGEHVVVIDPQEPPSPVPPEFPMLDTIASLSFAAAVTTRLRLGSGIILLAQRNLVVLAKELASVDVLSGGRLTFGIGGGYVQREFDVMGIPYEERGARVDDHIDAMRTLWTQDRPVQSPHPPFVIGGMSPAAYRRAITRGDGWYGFNQTEEQAATSIDGLRQAAEAAGTPERFDALEISVTPRGSIDTDRVKRFEDLGVSRLVLLPMPVAGSGSLLDGASRFIEDTTAALL